MVLLKKSYLLSVQVVILYIMNPELELIKVVDDAAALGHIGHRHLAHGHQRHAVELHHIQIVTEGRFTHSTEFTETAIAAYNGGPGNVNQWLRNPEYGNGDGILNKIPFRETRDYVQKVRKAYWNYQSIYHLDEGDVYDGTTEGFVL